MNHSLRGTLIAVAVAGIFAAGATAVRAEEEKAEGGVKCMGANSCKGQGACAGAGHECSGRNSCKGKGWAKTQTEQECKDKGGTVPK